MDKLSKDFIKSEDGRKWFIEKTIEVVPKDKNWQNIHTPYDFCEHMISKTTLEEKSILVLFNLEFLEVLIHRFNVPSKNIMFLADCEFEFNIATKRYIVDSNIINNVDNIQRELKKLKKFDLCFSNPPYGKGHQHTHLSILMEILKWCDEIIYVHPIGWLLKNKVNTLKKFLQAKNDLQNRVNEIEFFNPNPIFNIDQMDPCAIEHITGNNNNHIKVNYFNQNIYEVDNINDITIFCEQWNDIVKPFKFMIEDFIDKTKNIFIWNHRITSKDDLTKISNRKYFCQFTAMQPGTGDKSGIFMHGKDLYKLLNKDQDYKVDYVNINNKYGMLVYWFDTEIEVNNFLNYLKTDFVRFCLSIYKTSQSLDDGHMNLIPVMDFTKSWTDHDLYKYFNIPQETINYITNFFPEDLYELRK